MVISVRLFRAVTLQCVTLLYSAICWAPLIRPSSVLFHQHIKTEIKRGCHFADDIFKFIKFLVCKLLHFDWKFSQICFQMSNWHEANIYSDNGSALDRWFTIIWINDCMEYRRTIWQLPTMSLKPCNSCIEHLSASLTNVLQDSKKAPYAECCCIGSSFVVIFRCPKCHKHTIHFIHTLKNTK